MRAELTVLWITVVLLSLTNYLQRAELLQRLRRVELETRTLRQALGSPPDEGGDHPEVRALLRAGFRIKAIAAYRAETGTSPREARLAVEALQEGMR